MKKLTALLLLVSAVALVSYRVGEAQTALQICVDVPASQGTRVANAFSAAHGYQAQVQQPDGTLAANPQTRRQYMRQVIVQFIRESVKTYEAGQAAEDARKAAALKAEAEVVIQ
jgi:hypothetical protein